MWCMVNIAWFLIPSLKEHWTSITSFFLSNSIENFELNQYPNFQLILPMRFHFMQYFLKSIIFRVSNRFLYCVFIEVENAWNIYISSEVNHSRTKKLSMQSLHMPTLLIISKSHLFLEKVGDDVILVQCPFKYNFISCITNKSAVLDLFSTNKCTMFNLTVLCSVNKNTVF